MPKVSGKPKASPGKTTIQTLILSKARFKSKGAAKSWAKSNGYKSGGVDETDKSYRIRQFNPGDFKSGSLRTITLSNGVKAVVGKPSKTSAKADLGPTDIMAGKGKLQPRQGTQYRQQGRLPGEKPVKPLRGQVQQSEGSKQLKLKAELAQTLLSLSNILSRNLNLNLNLNK